MSLPDFIRRVLSSGLLAPQLVYVPETGASSSDLATLSLPADLHELLSWRNGCNLDVIRVHGLGDGNPEIPPLVANSDKTIEFASDPSGFRYLVRTGGAVVSVDHDGGTRMRIADDVEDFFGSFVFGTRAAEFAGDEWAQDVAKHLGSN
jgi:hypothetical protein